MGRFGEGVDVAFVGFSCVVEDPPMKVSMVVLSSGLCFCSITTNKTHRC